MPDSLCPISFEEISVLRNSAASVLLVQTALLDPAQVDNIVMADLGRREAIATLHSLLDTGSDGESLLEQYAQGPAHIVLMPEYAFGSGDWQAVDDLVRGCRRNLILVAGFGATIGHNLLAWHEAKPEGTVTKRLLPLHATHRISRGLRYNGGWCWVHDATNKRTWCVAFLKNYTEQDYEPGIVDGFGEESVALIFQDLVLFPNICADLLNDPETPESPHSRIAGALAALPLQKKALITGSLYQEKPWASTWQGRLAGLFEGLGNDRRRTIVALANRAAEVEDPDEQKDQWRSLSGIYTSRINNAEIWQPDMATRAVEHTNFSGGVVRRTDACVVFGEIQWEPYRSTAGKYLWRKCKVAAIRGDGTIGPVKDTPSVSGHELSRFLKRKKSNSTDRILLDGLAHVHGCLLSCERCIRADLLATTALYGIGRSSGFAPDNIHRLEAEGHDLSGALIALSYLTSPSMGMSWLTDSSQEGQLHWHDTKANILVWHHKGLKADVKATIKEWLSVSGAHPTLLVVADVKNGSIKPEIILPDRKVKISDSPDRPINEKDRVSQARSQRFAAIYPLKDVLERCHDPDSGTAEELLQDMGDLIGRATETAS